MSLAIHYIKTPSQVITNYLGISLDYKKKCIEEISKIGDEQNNQTQVKAHVSSYDLHLKNNTFTPLLNNIISFITNFYSSPIDEGVSKLSVKLDDFWSVIYKKGYEHYANPHRHLPSNLSFIYYLKADGESPLVFDGSDLSISPYEDLLVVFNSSIMHSVKKSILNKDRICVVGNVSIGYEPIIKK